MNQFLGVSEVHHGGNSANHAGYSGGQRMNPPKVSEAQYTNLEVKLLTQRLSEIDAKKERGEIQGEKNVRLSHGVRSNSQRPDLRP